MSENVSGLGPTTIKIKKNKGITHALKDMVDKLVEQKKAELTDGKITAQEWNAVLDKLVELQENRKAAGKASIFSGSTDKTQAGWHNSFVVHPDQEITFTAEETAEIYEAMGVVIKGGSAPVDPNDPADQPVDQEEPPEGTQTPAGQLPEGVTETAGKDENGHDCMIWKDQDGREIKRIYNNDNAEEKYSVTVEYGENGKKTKETETQYGDEKIDLIRYYNEDGKISKVEDYADDGTTINSTKTYEYNEDGSYKVTISGADENPDKVIEYDGSENPRPVKETVYKDDGTTVEYTTTYEYKDGKLSKETISGADEKPDKVIEYDGSENPRPVKETVYKDDGTTVKQTTTYEYKDGKLSKETFSGADEKPYKVIEYDGSENPRPVKETVYKDDGTTVKQTTTYEYKDGKLSRKTLSGAGNKTKIVREYDNTEREIKATFYEDDGQTINIIVTCTYKDDNSRTVTQTDGNNKLQMVTEYKNRDIINQTVYAEDGETPVHVVENGLVKMTHIATTDADGNAIEHKYDFDENGICTRSDLAVKLRQQIEPASLNKDTIKLLKQLNPENIIKVLTSYQYIEGEKIDSTLQQAIEDEWDLSNSKDTMRDLVQDALDERLRQLGLEPSEVDINDPEQLAEIARLDNIKSRGY